MTDCTSCVTLILLVYNAKSVYLLYSKLRYVANKMYSMLQAICNILMIVVSVLHLITEN